MLIRTQTNTKKKILYILQDYYNRGGVEEHVKTLTESLKDDFEVAVAFPELLGGAHNNYILLINGVPELVFPGPKIKWPVSEFEETSANFALKNLLSHFAPDLIHIHHLYNWPLNTLNIILNTEVPCIKSYHDYFMATPLFTMEFSNHPKELLEAEYSKKVFGVDISSYLKKRRVHLVSGLAKLKCRVVPSEFTKLELSKIFPAEYQVIEHGIELFTKLPKVSSNKIRFGYIGSFIRQKGFETLIKAFTQLTKEFKNKEHNIELHLFGGGQEYQQEEMKGLFYHGSYTSKDLANITSMFDIGIIPSIFKETFCYTFSELLHANIPIIASKIGTLESRMKEANLEEYLFEAGNVDQLVAKMKLAIKQDLKSRKIQTKVKSKEEMIEDYKNLYLKY